MQRRGVSALQIVENYTVVSVVDDSYLIIRMAVAIFIVTAFAFFE